MKTTPILIILLFIVSTYQEESFSYQHQNEWQGACATGKRQSPIDITVRNVMLCPRNKILIKKYSTQQTTINPQGENLKSPYLNQSKLTFYDTGDLRNFQSAQFHWHSPSEHTVNGNSFDLELHVVHVEDDNSSNYAVLGLLFRVSDDLLEDNLDVSQLVSDGSSHAFTFPFAIKDKMVYHYQGSLTTPPCSETVDWFVITEYFEITRKNFEKIQQAINEGHSNSREVQPLNGRNMMLLGKFCDFYTN